MATDYDAPRKTEEDQSEESIEELKARRHDKNSGKVDEDETEAAESFDAGGASDRADRERAELGVLQRYLPEQLSEEEIKAIVADAVAAAAAEGTTGPAAMGAVMKVVTPQTRGRADGGQVAALVKSALG